VKGIASDVPAFGTFCDIARLRTDFRFRCKSGRAAGITAMTGFDPSATSARNFCCDAQTTFLRNDVVMSGPKPEEGAHEATRVHHVARLGGAPALATAARSPTGQ